MKKHLHTKLNELNNLLLAEHIVCEEKDHYIVPTYAVKLLITAIMKHKRIIEVKETL